MTLRRRDRYARERAWMRLRSGLVLLGLVAVPLGMLLLSSL